MDKQKIKNIENQYFECCSKAMGQFLADKPVDKDSLYAITDEIRVLNNLAAFEAKAGGSLPPVNDDQSCSPVCPHSEMSLGTSSTAPSSESQSGKPVSKQ